MKKILIFGATSKIAQCTARHYAHENARIFLAARDLEKLKIVAQDLNALGAEHVDMGLFDAEDTPSHLKCVEEAVAMLNGLDVVLIAQGCLPDEGQCLNDYLTAEKCFQVNFLSVVSVTTHLIPILKKQGHGTIAMISSVAGDRGRAKVLNYGAAKAALSTYASGLRNLLAKDNIQVLTIKPGFVETPMTAHLPKGILFADAKIVAKHIYEAVEHKKDVIYTPGFWRLIMAVVKIIPERLFKYLKF